jgi:hypothetical protein
MSTRGNYGQAPNGVHVGALVVRQSSAMPWLVGGLAILGTLWMRHQAAQIEQLSKAAGLPHQSFGQNLRGLPSRAAAKLHELTAGKKGTP